MCFFLHFYNAFKSKRSLKMIMCYWHACLRLDMTDATAWIIWNGVSPEVFIRSQHFDLFNKAQRINSSSQEQQVTGSMFGLVFVRDYFWGFGTPRKKWNLKKRERKKQEPVQTPVNCVLPSSIDWHCERPLITALLLPDENFPLTLDPSSSFMWKAALKGSFQSCFPQGLFLSL